MGRFYDEDLDETIETIKCDKMTKTRFEEIYVRKRKPVKIVGCIEQSDLAKFSVEHLFQSFKESGLSFDAKIFSDNKTQAVKTIDEAILGINDGKIATLEVGLTTCAF